MGPRPFGRGDVWHAPVQRVPRSFNGAAAFRPRRRFLGGQRFPELHASMGPRPFGRGDAAVDELVELVRDASMGPRPFGRGDRAVCAHRTLSRRFNGAAAFRPRRRSLHGLHSLVADSFNGAAAFRPRRRICFEHRGYPRKLQWGRGLSAAETFAESGACRK